MRGVSLDTSIIVICACNTLNDADELLTPEGEVAVNKTIKYKRM